MKIAILTFFESENYGTVLQAYALQKYLENEGHAVELLHLKRDVNKTSARYTPETISNTLAEKLWYKAVSWRYRDAAAKKAVAFNKFREKYLHASRFYETDEQLLNELPPYDVYISGGDQVWNPYHKVFSKHFMFDFLPDAAARISYGSSFGVSCIDDEKVLKAMHECLQKYRSIAVRESSGVDILSGIGLKATQVMDPVFLIEDDWARYVKSVRPKKYCVVYGLISYPKEEDAIIRRFAKQRGLEVIVLPENRRNSLNCYCKAFDLSPEHFLCLLANAEYVFTNSFHGMAFSVLFGKQFVLLDATSEEGREKRGRLLDLLGVLEIGDRPISALNTPIDYGAVRIRLNRQIEKSKEYLLAAINSIRESDNNVL